MPSYPFYPNARPDADRDDLADWTVGEFPTFEKAVNSGASTYRPAAPWGSEVIKTAGRKEPSKRENFERSLTENGFTLGEVARLGARATAYGLKHRDDRKIALGEFNAKNGVISPEEDRVNRKFLQSIQHTADGQKAFQKYNEFISNGKIRVVR